MMRKFPKLLAVVLAIAIIICPAMCLTSMAESTNDYSVSYADGVVTVNVSATEGFLVALLRLDVEGFTVDEEGIAVTTDPVLENGFAANPDFDAEAGTLSLLLASRDEADITLVNTAIVTIPVTKTAEDDNYGITLTTIQAADKGSTDEATGEIIAEDFLEFPYVNNAEDGTISAEAGDKVVAVAPCAHANTTTTTVDATCEADGSVTVTCGDCGAVISEEVIPALGHEYSYEDLGDGTHSVVCANGHTEAAEAHTDEDADNLCDKCEAELVVEPPHTCEFVYTVNYDGTHDGACECGESVTAEACVDEDADNLCDKCGYTTVLDFTFSNPVYDLSTSKLTVNRSKPSAEFLAQAAAAKSAGNRVMKLVVVIDGGEVLFDVSITQGAGTIFAFGFPLEYYDKEVTMFVRITADNFETYESNYFKTKINDILIAAGDAKSQAAAALGSAAGTAPTFSLTDKATAGSDFTFSNVTYNAATSTLTANRSKPSAEFLAQAAAAKSAGNRVMKLVVVIDGGEVLFDVSITQGAGTIFAFGFPLEYYNKDITMFVRITADNFETYESNKVIANIGEGIIASGDDGAYAQAYAQWVAANS